MRQQVAQLFWMLLLLSSLFTKKRHYCQNHLSFLLISAQIRLPPSITDGGNTEFYNNIGKGFIFDVIDNRLVDITCVWVLIPISFGSVIPTKDELANSLFIISASI